MVFAAPFSVDGAEVSARRKTSPRARSAITTSQPTLFRLRGQVIARRPEQVYDVGLGSRTGHVAKHPTTTASTSATITGPIATRCAKSWGDVTVNLAPEGADAVFLATRLLTGLVLGGQRLGRFLPPVAPAHLRQQGLGRVEVIDLRRIDHDGHSPSDAPTAGVGRLLG